jgi:type II secretory ATPase GspE/PulE/Tfp pilus assembly ATPase PilB-like protein
MIEDKFLLDGMRKIYADIEDVASNIGNLIDHSAFDHANILRTSSLYTLDYFFVDAIGKHQFKTIDQVDHSGLWMTVVIRDSPVLTTSLLLKMSETLSRNSSNYKIRDFQIIDDESFALVENQVKNKIINASDEEVSEEDAELSREVKTLLSEAQHNGVSDVHVEVSYSEQVAKIFMRFNGVRYLAGNLPHEKADRYIRYLYKLAKGNSGTEWHESRSNNWRNEFESTVNKDELVTVRYNQVAATDEMLSATMRLNSKLKRYIRKEPLDLLENGFTPQQASAAQSLVAKTSGFLLVSGKTNVGKTTFNSSFLDLKAKLIPESPKFISLEDPVELNQNWILRVDLNEWAGGDGKKAPVMDILRQDTDVIYMGELRDEEGGKLAFDAYNTGNLTLSTTHTGNAFAALEKVEKVGGWSKESVLNPNAVIGVVQLWLHDVLCKHCALTFDEAMSKYPELKDPSNLASHETLRRDNIKDMHSGFDKYLTEAQKSKIRFRNYEGCNHCKKHIKEVEFIQGRKTQLGELGNEARRNWTAEVLVSSHVLSDYLNRTDMIEGDHYYKTLYRLQEYGAHAGFLAEDHAAHKVLSGRMCPTFFFNNYGSWLRYFNTCASYEADINSQVLKEGFSINGARGFDFISYLENPALVEDWQQEYREKREAIEERRRHKILNGNDEEVAAHV